MYSSGSSTPDLGYYKLPPIVTTEADREFLNEVDSYIDAELGKINHLNEEERYLVFKTVFNKVIEHVTAYKPVLVQIKKEYEDTIETIKKGQREAIFLQEKLKAMASEPSTLRNYRKRADELEERMAIIKKKNEQLQLELAQMRLAKEEKEKRPKTAETPERQLKKDSRLIPGLSIEESTDMKILQKKYETVDRQLKELNLSLRARFLPKTHKLQLKESLDNKVTYRDQLLWQSQVYKARGQRLKIALEAAQAYNQMKPPHQTVGDAVTIAFQHALGMLRAQKEKTEGEQTDAAQATTFEDDDPNKEKEAEMMLEYIEKFNELFEDGLFEEAAVHAANSPKGILRTQATLAKFRDVKVKTKGRSPLLAFCDSIMSSVKAAGCRPNEALSMDCMEACLNENRLDLAYHWLSQDRLTQSAGLGQIISKHCSCPLPCKCGCQALAQSVFTKLKCHQEVIPTMLKQGKIQGALQYGRLRQCITDDNVGALLSEMSDQNLVKGLMEGDSNGSKILTELNFGSLLLALVELNKIDQVAELIQGMLKHAPVDGDATTALLSLQAAVASDTSTTPDQWLVVMEALSMAGHQDTMYQLLAMTFVVDAVQKAWKTAQDVKKGVSFSAEAQESCDDDDMKAKESSSEEEDCEETGRESSVGLSSRSRDSVSVDHSSRETSPEISKQKIPQKDLVLKKKVHEKHHNEPDRSSPESSPRKSPRKKRMVRMSKSKRNPADKKDEDDSDDGQKRNTEKKSVGFATVVENDSPSKSKIGESRVKFDEEPGDETYKENDVAENKIKKLSFETPDDENKTQSNEAGDTLEKSEADEKLELEPDKGDGMKVHDSKENEQSLEMDDKKECNVEDACEKLTEINHDEESVAVGTENALVDEVIIDKIEQANMAEETPGNGDESKE